MTVGAGGRHEYSFNFYDGSRRVYTFFSLVPGHFSKKFSYLKEKYYNLLLKTPRKRIFHALAKMLIKKGQ